MPGPATQNSRGLAWLLMIGGCAHTGAPAANGHARVYHYFDDGLGVTTANAVVEQPVNARWSLIAGAWVDRVNAGGGSQAAPEPGATREADQPQEHQHDTGIDASPLSAAEAEVDAVSSASTLVADGQAAKETRVEGMLGAALRGQVAGAPYEMRVTARAGREPDYLSMSAAWLGSVELADRNFRLATYVGYGRDRIAPLQAPPGQSNDWPSTRRRLYAGLSFSQDLSPRLVLSAGVDLTAQKGSLSNPYRRVAVRSPRAADTALPTYFAETLPSTRLRARFHLGVSWFIGWQTALHVSQGLYQDDWGLTALIPRVALVNTPHPDLLATVSYRLYRQWRANLFSPEFTGREEALRSSDPRLGPLVEQAIGFELRWAWLGNVATAGASDLVVSYDLGLLDYRDLPRDLAVSHILSAGAAARW